MNVFIANLSLRPIYPTARDYGAIGVFSSFEAAEREIESILSKAYKGSKSLKKSGKFWVFDDVWQVAHIDKLPLNTRFGIVVYDHNCSELYRDVPCENKRGNA